MLSFDVWDQLLQRYVDGQGKVDYHAWQTEAVPPLKAWLQQAAALHLTPPQTALERDQQLAFWLNLYNALVIEQIIDRYPITSIRPTWLGIPNWIAFLRFFQRKIYRLHDQSYSLNEIEHGVIRTQFRDPRIHFAVVCAANGCPLLRNAAYQPERVQSQLEADAQRFINNPEKVRYDSSTLYCSKIFKWYQKDFLSVSPSIAAYIQNYLATPLERGSSTPVRYLDYDWRLNQRNQRTSS